MFAVWWGGTRGWFGDRLLQSGAALLLALVVTYIGFARSRVSLPWQIEVIAAVLVLVPVLAWLGLASPTLGFSAGALQLRSDLAMAGVDRSGTSMAAELALWSVFPALAMLIAASLVGPRGRLLLLGLCIVLGMAEGVLAISQLSTRGFGWVRFMWPGEVGVYLGTFANRNHLASLLLSMLPLCVAQATVPTMYEAPGTLLVRRVLWASAGLILFTGIVGSQSRSGLGLALLAIGGTLAVMLRAKHRVRAMLAATAAAAMWLAFGGYRLAELTISRMFDPARSDARLTYLGNALGMSSEFGVGGIGFGNFERLYGAHMGDAGLARMSVNHVHNDWMELILETGWIGVIALGVVTFVFVRMGVDLWRAWRRHRDVTISLVPGAAWLGAAAIALHSLVDFPLRTTAISCVLGLLLATVFATPAQPSGRRALSSGRSTRVPPPVEPA